LFGKKLWGSVNPEIWIAVFRFIADAMVHQDWNTNTSLLREDSHKVFEKVKGKETIYSEHRRV
jgi:hypothetical protein